MTYKLTVTYTSSPADVETCEGFEELSAAIDRAWGTPGFAGYRVEGA